jgi:hypothetical protein
MHAGVWHAGSSHASYMRQLRCMYVACSLVVCSLLAASLSHDLGRCILASQVVLPSISWRSSSGFCFGLAWVDKR